MPIVSQPTSIHPDTLRWAIFLALLGPSAALAQGRLEAATGPAGTPIINSGHRVPVIDIVAPNSKGLSHNQFVDYNVASAGVVLNNGLQAGVSKLAGALTANPQFHGQAASTILNEVISRNASLIEGPQEIFGRSADYILANPNGITLNGGSFINTTRAGFVVGTPELQDEQLRSLNTLNANGILQVLEGGQSNSDGALELIAPRIDSKGLLEARGDLDLTLGRNRIAAEDRRIVEHQPGTPSRIDASLFGAMRAGRIRVVSTAEGAGVRMGPAFMKADSGIEIHSAGSLQIEGRADQPSELHSGTGALRLSAADDLTLSAIDGKADQIEAKAGKKLTLDAQTRKRITHDRENWKKKFLFITRETYSRETTTTEQQSLGVSLQSRGDTALRSGADMKMVAAQVDTGGELNLESGAGLDILAGIDSKQTQTQVRHRKDLWRGDSDTDSYSETAQPSRLNAERMTVKAKDTLRVQGSTLHSQGNQDIKAAKIEIGTLALEQRGNADHYQGDLVSGTFFGARKGNDIQGHSLAGSQVTADGKLAMTAEQVSIKGSTVQGAQDAVLFSEKGVLAVEADHGKSRTVEREHDSKLFGLIANERENTTRTQHVLTSDVSSSSNLRLASRDELRIQGAKVTAGAHLQVDAKGKVLIGSTQSVDERDTHDQRRGLTASARQTQQAEDGKPDSRQYAASLGYAVNTGTEQMRNSTQIASELTGSSIALTSDSHVQIDGSKVQANAGDLDVHARQVTLGVSHQERDTTSSNTQSGGALTLTGGIDRLGSLVEGHHNNTQVSEHERKVLRSELQASGNLTLTADTMVNQAAKVNAGQTLEVTARHIDNRAVEDSHERTEVRNDWSGSLGASLEYRDLTRPIERLVQGEEAARFQQASPEDAMAAPSIGGDMTVEHLKRLENQRRGFAQVNEMSGARVKVKADTLDDQATAWRANAGKLQIEAQQHNLLAASNTRQESVQRLAYGGDLRIDTSTGSDLNVRGAGHGGSQHRQTVTNTAVPGSLYGQQGIHVQLGSSGRYEGTRFDGGKGDVLLQSGGSLSLPQATDRTEQLARQLDGNAWAKVGNRPGSTGVDTRGYLDHDQRQATQTTAQVGQIDAQGRVLLNAGGDLSLEGTRIGARQAKPVEIALHSEGLLQVRAAGNTQSATGGKLGGGLELAVKTGNTKGGGMGGHFEHGKQTEDARQSLDAQFTSAGKLTLTSAAREDVALHLQGLQASAGQIALNAAGGGMHIEGSSNHERRDNLAISAGAGFNMSKGATDTRGLHARAKVDLDQRDNQTWNTSDLRADRIDLQSRGDTRIEGASLEAGRISGAVEGDLHIASRKDRIDTLRVNGDARLSQEKNPQGYINAATSLAGPLGDKVNDKAGPALGKADPNLSPTLKLEVSQAQRDTVARQTAIKGSDGVDLQVGGDARLVGARLQSANGEVALAAKAITRESLNGNDYRRDVSIDASNSLSDLGTAIADIAKSKGAAQGENALDLGLLRTSGHDRNEQWASSVQGKRGHSETSGNQ